MVAWLTLDDLLLLARELELGPARDIGLLQSAAQRPSTTLMGQDAYPSIELKAAALMHSLVCNHALVDGNKRLGWHATAVFLWINGRAVTHTNEEAFDLTMAVASGELRDVEEIAARLKTVARE